MEIKKYNLKSNGDFSIVEGPFDMKQHPNQQEGLDRYVKVLDHSTGVVNCVKLYENSIGLHFKKNGSHYLADFILSSIYVPYQVKVLDYDHP